MNSSEAPLTVRQGVIIVSRALCVYLLLEAMVNLSGFPGHIAGLMRAYQEVSVVGDRLNYMVGVYVRDLAVATLRLAIELFLAWWFYRCGSSVAKFLLAESDSPESPETQG